MILLLIGIALAILVAMHLGKGYQNKGINEMITFFDVWDKEVVPYMHQDNNEENTETQNVIDKYMKE